MWRPRLPKTNLYPTGSLYRGMILYGPCSTQLALDVSKLLGVEAVRFETKVFPDGESYVRLPPTRPLDDVILINTMFPEQDKRFVETLLMCDSLKRNGAERITLVIPYLAYARQDKVFLPGEPVSPRPIGQALRCSGVDQVFVVEAHSEEAVTALGPVAHNVKVFESLCEAIGRLEGGPQVVAAPDVKAAQRAKALADRLGLEFVSFRKHRDRVTGEVRTQMEVEVDVNGKTVVFVDDIISTGGSIASAASILKSMGADRIFAVAIHALMVGNAQQVLSSSGVLRVLGSNTIENRFTAYSVAREVAAALRSHGVGAK